MFSIRVRALQRDVHAKYAVLLPFAPEPSRPYFYRVATANRSFRNHFGVNAYRGKRLASERNMHLVVNDALMKDAEVFRQITLRQSRHHATGTGVGDLQPNLSAYANDLPNPIVFDESLLSSSIDH
jgi:hypothetical protein